MTTRGPVHLIVGDGAVWCPVGDDSFAETDDPHQATCVDCLRAAAKYGAAAAMRCAAVEAGGGSDPELERERDVAIQELQQHRRAIHQIGLFVCTGCHAALDMSKLGYHIGTQGWCASCMRQRSPA